MAQQYPSPFVWRLLAGRIAVACLSLMIVAMSGHVEAQEIPVVHLHAAGSLRAAMTEIAHAFTAASGIKVEMAFSSSGLLRERFEKGEAGDVFASADMGNPLTLKEEGKAGPVVLFARNRLCAIARPGLPITSDRLLAAMLDPAVRLGTSTPGADPSGDYASEVFRKADAIRRCRRRGRTRSRGICARGERISSSPTAVAEPRSPRNYRVPRSSRCQPLWRLAPITA
jgi:ABC-type molybdate transport system substrate-binding protein